MAVPTPARSPFRPHPPGRVPLLVGGIVAVAAAACRVAPEPLPPWPVDDGPLIAGAWKPADAGAAPGETRDPPPPAGLASLDAGRWAAEIEPSDAGRIPDVTVTLEERLVEGATAGTADYDFGGFACRYMLRVDAIAGQTLRLRQRRETGPCGSTGPLLLSWDDEGSLVGEWRQIGGTPWFRVTLARLELEAGR